MESDVTVQAGAAPEKKRKEEPVNEETLYCWGAHTYGQLGLGGIDDEQIIAPRQLIMLPRMRVLNIACGEKHTLVLMQDGTVYSCGNNDCGQIGRSSDNKVLQQILALSTHIITQIACGQSHSIAVADNGQLFSWGDSTFGQLGCGFTDDKFITSPKLVKALVQHTVVQIACGYQHTVVLTDDSQLFSWGKNTYGQLGLGPDVVTIDTPQVLTSLQGLGIRQVAANGFHTMALTVSGALFGWGKNDCGQLGIKQQQDKCSYAKLVKTLRNQRVKFVCCGEDHTVALTQEGGVFTFGSGRYGQLGHNSLQDEPLPRKVFEVMGSTVTQVACGRRHTIAYVVSTGRLYSFGLRANGQLGLGSLSKHSSPTHINASFTTSRHSAACVIKRVVTGGDHCFAIVTPNRSASVDMRSGDVIRRILVVDESCVNEYSSFLSGQRPSLPVLNEVEKLFSSAGCINASFLLHNDDHYACSSKHHGVNLELAKEYFLRIAKLPNNHISACALASIERYLVSSLRDSPPDVEAMRIYLTLPCCAAFQDASNFKTIIVPFATALLKLQPKPAEVVERWWEISPAEYFNYLISVYKSVVVHILFLPNPNNEIDILERQKGLHVCMRLLEKLNKVNRRSGGHLVAYHQFYIPQLNDKVDIRSDYINWIQSSYSREGMVSFCHYPFVFDAQAKTVLLQTDAIIQMQTAFDEVMRRNLMGIIMQAPMDRVNPCLVLYVNRNALVRDTINQLQKKGSADLKKPLKVSVSNNLIR